MKHITQLGCFIIALFCVLIPGRFYAQQPQLEVTLIDSLTIPYTYDHVFQLPNGDLQFYKLNYTASSIQFSAFQFLSQTNEITVQEDVGTIADLNGLDPIRSYTIERFGNFYLVHKMVSGLAVFKLDQNNLSSRIISEFNFDQYFNIHSMTKIVSEDAMAIALADSLVYFNFMNGSSRTLLQGAEYQCVNEQYPAVVALPENYFMYIKDTGGGGLPEIWVIYDSDGQYLFSQSSNDESLRMSLFKSGATKLVHGRWYIPAYTIVYDDLWLECSFSEPDSLHFYSIGEYPMSALDLFPFGDNRILRLCYNEFFESVIMYCNYVPLEQFPEEIYTFDWGHYYPILKPISDDIITMTVRLQDQIAILALWTDDFPAVHEFYFPASSDYLGSTSVFADNSLLRVITNQKLYSFHVGISSSIADETLENIDRIIMAYPNPVRTSQQLMITSMSKEPSIIEIYNIRGQIVQTLEMGKSGQIEWDLRDHENLKLPSGVYIIKSRNRIATKPCKLVLIN
jgi:hypothetical protein